MQAASRMPMARQYVATKTATAKRFTNISLFLHISRRKIAPKFIKNYPREALGNRGVSLLGGRQNCLGLGFVTEAIS
jgi:hypothetical protein